MLRNIKIALIFTVFLWGVFGTLYNLTNWGETTGAVLAVTSMTTFDDGANSWQATSNLAIVWIGALFIVLSKVATAVLCGIGAWRMWQARSSDPAAFANARQIALAGCGVAVIMLFGGFVVIAENFYDLWRSDTFGATVLAGAFRYGAMIALIGILVGSTDD